MRYAGFLVFLALSPTEAPPKKPQKAVSVFQQKIAGAEKKEGVWNFYLKEGRLLVGIPKDALEQDHLLLATVARGLGALFIARGEPLDSAVVYWRKNHDKLQLVARNFYVRIDPKKPEAWGIKRNLADSPIASFRILAEDRETGMILIDMTDFLLSDFSGTAQFLRLVTGRSYRADPREGFIEEVRAYPENAEITVRMVFKGGSGLFPPTGLPRGEAFELGVRYSVLRLRDTGFRPRYADQRVGYFLVTHYNFTEDEQWSDFARWIIRWNLRKKDPNAPISEPVKPLIYWIDRATPTEYRDYVRQGIEVWQKAFEAAGFRNAILAKQMPEDAEWSPEDVRYHVVVWNTSMQIWYAGYGPSRVHPGTGEILDADPVIEGSVIRGVKRRFAQLVLPKLSPPAPPRLPYGPLFACENQVLGAAQAGFGMVALEAFYGEPMLSELREKLLRQYIVSLVAHEVGHTLGLRHNFKASTLLQPEETMDPEVTGTRGLSSSVMDYLTINLSPPGKPQGDFYEETVGPWDVFAIRYGYTEFPDAESPEDELSELRALASEATRDPALAYGTDEDVGANTDPYAMVWDLSSDPLTYASWRIEIAREVIPKLYPRALRAGDSLYWLRYMVRSMLSMMGYNAYIISRFVGGVQVRRLQKGDTAMGPALEPIPAETQRRAMDLLDKYLWKDDYFQLPPDLWQLLQPGRWLHRNSWEYDSPPLEFPLRRLVADLRARVLDQLLSVDVLQRLLELEAIQPGGYTLSEHLQRLSNTFLSTLLGSEPPSIFQRDLHRMFVARLLQLLRLRGPEYGELRAQARFLLGHWKKQLEARLPTLEEPTWRAHAEDLLAEITRALQALEIR